MNIPINGRIAIVDDKFDHARPLMELFGKNQFPYLYYDGSAKNLPNPETNNDIRILFLDIYLTGDASMSEQQIKSTLIPVIDRIISANNYPYMLIYWSRHEKEHGKLVASIFKNELKHKAPISFLSLQKTDYFELSGEKTDLHDEKIPELMSRINSAIATSPVYSYLMAWENLIHRSADLTLEEIFRINQTTTDWKLNSNYLFNKLGHSFAGKSYKNQNELEKIKSSFYSLNFVFTDSLEYSISSDYTLENPAPLKIEAPINPETVYSVNKKLLFADEVADMYLPGIIFKSKDNHNYGEILNFSIDRGKVLEEHEKNIYEKLKLIAEEVVLRKEKKKLEEGIINEFKEKVKGNYMCVEVNVTPICDYAQGKCIYFRIVPGILIDSRFSQYFNQRSEALFTSPPFKPSSESKENYFLILDFRLFTSIPQSDFDEDMIPFLRIRQILLSEIQSKLSRHINRQGILFLEE